MLKHQVKHLLRSTPQPRRRSIPENDTDYRISTHDGGGLSASFDDGGGGGKSPSTSSQDSDLSSGFGDVSSSISSRGRTLTPTAGASPRAAAGGGGGRGRRSCSVSSMSSGDSGSDRLLLGSRLPASPTSITEVSYGRDTGCLKVYTDAIRPETDYKTIFGTTTMHSAEIIEILLSKFRIGYKDPKLFYITMELHTRSEGGVDVETTIILDDDSRPLELQNCHPNGKSKFRLKMEPGVATRIYDYCVSPQSNYKSVLVSRTTTCDDAVGLMLLSSRLDSSNEDFVLVSVDTKTGYDYILPAQSCLLAVYDTNSQYCQLHLRYANSQYLLTSPLSDKTTCITTDTPLRRQHRLEDIVHNTRKRFASVLTLSG